MTWALLLALARRASRTERLKVAALVLVASAGEVLGSLILGLYAYRRRGVPAFVPPGHGLVHLAGARLAQSGSCARTRASVIPAAAGGALGRSARSSWPGRGRRRRARDGRQLASLARGAGPDLFACMFLVVAVLELYGTRMGVWEWRAPGRGCRSACATASADSPPAAAARRIATAAAVRRIAPAPGR